MSNLARKIQTETKWINITKLFRQIYRLKREREQRGNSDVIEFHVHPSKVAAARACPFLKKL